MLCVLLTPLSASSLALASASGLGAWRVASPSTRLSPRMNSAACTQGRLTSMDSTIQMLCSRRDGAAADKQTAG